MDSKLLDYTIDRRKRMEERGLLLDEQKMRPAKFPKVKGKKKRKREKEKSGFYESLGWQQVRYQALRRNDGRCECCGRSRHDGVTLHVDHIKPRSKFPQLQFSLSNLQVLCEDYNIGKGNRDMTDWRKSGESAT